MSDVDPIYEQLAAKIFGGRGTGGNMAKILAKMANLEQAKLITALPDQDRSASAGRSLEVSDKFAQKLGLDKKTVDKHIRELYEKGLLFPTKNGPQMARTYLQLHDAALATKWNKELGKEFFELWGGPQGKITRKPPKEVNERFAAFRVIPRWKSIKDLPGVLPHEDVRQILKSQEFIAIVPCGCKRSFTKRDCNIPEEVCISVGRTAEYNIDRGAGRRITYEEAMKINDELDNYQVINTVVNQREVNQLVCNCHNCCCGSVGSAAKSRFQAEVDPDNCTACGICVERCQYGAISMKVYPGVEGEKAYVDADACRGCGCCVISCPHEARKMKIVRPPEHIREAGAIY